MADGPARRFPWYDSQWLANYYTARDHIACFHPAALDRFEQAVTVLRTAPDFEAGRVDLISRDAHEQLRRRAATLLESPVEEHERSVFGRGVVHDDPLFTEFQHDLTDAVSELVGEPVAPVYNFLADYRTRGICRLHIDAPEAKWTVDHCLDTNVEWPLHVSKVVPWPDGLLEPLNGWANRIRTDPSNRVVDHVLRPGETLLFAGSSQWHYREPIPSTTRNPFARMLFFHFTPATATRLIDQTTWSAHFDLACLSELLVTDS